MIPRFLLTLALLIICTGSAHADSPRLGIAIDVQGEGFFLNPVVTKVLVTKVEKASLAADAGIVAGDEIIQVEGQTIVGRRARDLQPLMKFNAGESRTLRLKRANGEQFEACITKPKN